MEYRELNSTFEYEGKTLKVVKAIKGCKGCYLFNKEAAICMAEGSRNCTPLYRADGRDIIYQKVKTSNKE